MKSYPFYVRYSGWPADGVDWIHPEDREAANRLLPSDRIFRCDKEENGYYVLRYGTEMLRVKPVLWQTVAPDGFDVDDEVQIRSKLGENEPGLARIAEMEWSSYHRCIVYRLQQNEMMLPNEFTSDDLQSLDDQGPSMLL